jgi:hypothetical protein
MIAYIASTGGNIQVRTPTPAGPPPHGLSHAVDPLPTILISAITVIDTDGKNHRAFLQNEQEKNNLSWGESEAGYEIVYTLPLHDDQESSYLFALNPITGQSRRVYPPQEITTLHCPATISRNGSGSLQISINNSSLLPADVHVLLRASSQRFLPTSKLNTNIMRSENITVPASSTQVVDWAVKAQTGLATYISVSVNPDTTFPMDEKRCEAQNTYDERLSWLPNLPNLTIVLPLSAFGLLLCTPWLRRQKKRAIWFLYLTIPILVILLIFIEGWMVWMHLP